MLVGRVNNNGFAFKGIYDPNILVTGSSGYLGSHLVPKLVADGYNCIICCRDKNKQEYLSKVISEINQTKKDKSLCSFVNIDLTNEQLVNKFLNMNKGIDVVAHLCASTYNSESLINPRKYYDNNVLELDCKLGDIKESILSTNVYLGAEGIIEALENGADIVITGRVSDPALSIGPLVHEFGWNIKDDADKMGQATLVGHLLECAGQVTGGYYADPGYKDVPDLDKLGFPLIEIDETGKFVVTKVEGSGGLVCEDTCKEQMIYEIHNPERYLTPDTVADFSHVTFTQVGKDRVEAAHATSHGKPETLKVSVGYKDCFIGEGEISYGGMNCMNRAKLAADIVEKRLKLVGVEMEEFRIDYIGYNSLYKSEISDQYAPDVFPEIRLRVSGRTKDKANATLIANEVEALYTNGPAGGAGATKKVSEIVSICSIFVPRDIIKIEVGYKEV